MMNLFIDRNEKECDMVTKFEIRRKKPISINNANYSENIIIIIDDTYQSLCKQVVSYHLELIIIDR